MVKNKFLSRASETRKSKSVRRIYIVENVIEYPTNGGYNPLNPVSYQHQLSA